MRGKLFPYFTDLILFPTAIGIYKPADVRPILQAYEGKDIPIEYAKKEAEAKTAYVEDWEKSHKGAVSGFTLSSLFGGSSVSPALRVGSSIGDG